MESEIRMLDELISAREEEGVKFLLSRVNTVTALNLPVQTLNKETLWEKHLAHWSRGVPLKIIEV